MECTVSTESGRTWQEYSNVVLPCPSCKAWVTPEREHLTGWQGAETQQAARTAGAFACPSCGDVWSQEQRVQANTGARILHEGQSIDDDGNVIGDLPQHQLSPEDAASSGHLSALRAPLGRGAEVVAAGRAWQTVQRAH